ncbi:Scd6-like Sm domain-containing protein [Achaetomium macrosporum]|uniref:Scd6-like Sm domain-containing protein n=1 Tax=Achaetomium macrosporum TaxID=79813 RepID=A0AAN7HEJ6_9PEZI|nr:Scd6-like Sm domain-containing protein [Achaetomium macrosporum]
MSEFLGSRISLISRSDIRYVGILHSINSDDSTVSLENVRSFGTEDRKADPDEFVPPSEQLYEYIVFRGTDVKDLRIEEAPAAVKEPEPPAMPNDPAIVGARPQPRNVAPGPPVPPGPQGSQGPQGPMGHPGPQNQQGPPPGAPGFGYFPPHMGGWGRAGAPGPGPFGGMPYPPPGWFPPGQEFPPMGHGPWNPYPFQPGPGVPPGAPGAPGAPGQGRQSANRTPGNQAPPQKPAPIGPAADRKPTTPSQQAGPTSESKAVGQPPKQQVAAGAPTPPVESKPSVEEVKATAASLANQSAAAAAGEPAKAIPTGPKSSRPTQILPAVPLPAALTAKAAQATQAPPKPVTEQPSAAAAAAALRDATQAAKEAVAVAMAKLDNSATLPQAETNGMDNLAKKVQEMRVNAARTGHGNKGDRADRGDRGGRGRGGPRPAKVEVPDVDFDFASANAKFNKQDVVKEAIAGSPLTEMPAGNVVTSDAAADAPAPVEPAYNKNKSFFDNISREAKDKENPAEKLGGRQWREEQTRKNIETFGQGSVDGGHRGFGRGRGRGRGGRGRGYRGGRGGSGGYRPRETQPAAQ